MKQSLSVSKRNRAHGTLLALVQSLALPWHLKGQAEQVTHEGHMPISSLKSTLCLGSCAFQSSVKSL